jgi:NhaP-type Na+/H+ or K+/H+ antiporter
METHQKGIVSSMSDFSKVLFFILGILAGIIVGVFLFNAIFTVVRHPDKRDAKHVGALIAWVAGAIVLLVFFALVLHSWLAYVLGLIVGYTPYFHVSNSETDKQKEAAFKANDKWNAKSQEERREKEEARKQKALEKRLEKGSR